MFILDEIKFKSLHISRYYSQRRQVFLDVELLMLPGLYEVYVQTRIFCKPMNKFLSILWSLAHFLFVKKVFIKAELTQFTTICLQERYYIETTQLFYCNLRYHGYLTNIPISWFKQSSYSNHWALQIPKKIVKVDILLLFPFICNEIWKYINVKKVAEYMQKNELRVNALTFFSNHS